MSTKRIIDLQTASTLGSDDYVMIDSATSGTKKYAISELKTAIEDVEDGSGISAGAIGTEALDDGAVTNAKLGALSVGTSNLQNGAVTLAKIASGSEATTSASGLMSSTDKAKLDAFGAASTYALKTEIAGAYIYRGSVANEAALPVTGQKVGDVYNIIAASSYGQAGANVAWNGSDWDALGETFDIGNGTVTTGKIADLNVTEGKLANSAVTTNKIADGNVTTAKIADANVTTGKLANLGVTTGKIANSAVTSDKIASNAVITEKITDGAITANKLDANAVTTAKINNLAVTTDKLGSESVTSAKLASNSVTTAKIVDSAVTEGKLANSAVTTNKINNSAVTTAKIADSNVTTAKIADSNVTTAKIADLNVTEGKLANSAVTTNKLNNSAVTTAKIADANVTTAKLADLNVTTGKLANAAVTTDKVADGAITRNKLNEEVTDELDFKADVDGYYTDMTVGAADNLTGRGDATTAEFLYRTAGGTADIETGQAVAKSIKGNTLVWNQLVQNGNFSSSDKWSLSGGTRTTENNIVTIITSANYATLGQTLQAAASVILGHKYLFSYEIKTDSSVQAYVAASEISKRMVLNTGSLYYGNWCKRAAILECQETYSSGISFQSPNGSEGNTIQLANVQLFDLTQMFGSGNEPSTVAEFEALFPLPYYEYDAGSLLSVNMEGIETVGFNQWDEEWENKGIDPSNGAIITDNTKIVSKNLIPVFPSTMYYCKSPNVATYAFWYDANGDYLGFLVTSIQNATFQTPANCHYMRVRVGDSTHPATTYNHDICINLSWSGRRNGEYEPYWSSQRLIDVTTYFPDGMRSTALDVYDELTATEAIQMVGTFVVDGVNYKAIYLNSGTGDSSGINRYAINTPANVVTSGAGTRLKGAPYTWTGSSRAVSATQWKDGDAFFWRENTSNPWVLFLCKSGFSSLAEFNAWLQANPQTFTYRATPTITPIDPPLNLSYRVDDFGTERVMVPEDERSAPPVLDIAYGLNVVDFVRRAPSEYISHASFQQFCIALQTKLGIVITETWDDTDNRYEYSIADAPSSNEG